MSYLSARIGAMAGIWTSSARAQERLTEVNRGIPPEVLSALAVTTASSSGRCGRRGSHGKPCRNPASPNAPACQTHLTDEEWDERDRLVGEAQQVLARWRDRDDPACWSWVVTEEDLRIAADFGEYSAADGWLWDWQQGRCAACGHGRRVRLVRDHDHNTGLVRGWLCDTCNWKEPGSEHGPLAKYRRRHPASMLGLELRYYNPIHGWAKPVEPLDPESHPGQKIADLLGITEDGQHDRPAA